MLSCERAGKRDAPPRRRQTIPGDGFNPSAARGIGCFLEWFLVLNNPPSRHCSTTITSSLRGSMTQFDIPLDEDGKIIDFLTEEPLEPKPEEFVRQQYLRTLHFEYLYPKNVLA